MFFWSFFIVQFVLGESLSPNIISYPGFSPPKKISGGRYQERKCDMLKHTCVLGVVFKIDKKE